ncbi:MULTISPECIES: endo-1,4-beta-xylanase [unclassified Microbacterium]|uniref:endo-1,4-beta-xylanase n=1 Tax=unclassified Microbacterium TaxID=2609290 RepID=UPI0012F8DB3A|nr:endo-1,4-beta-xylanase [Microbacterium sp. MAH-37]MVQ42681.1 1,4-beta-xylanase [Microbacterium sp. MAH-37]
MTDQSTLSRHRHREANASVLVVDAHGRPLRDADVTVAQVRHEFGFGCTAPGAPGDTMLGQWLDVFDTATLQFYWGRYEPVPGRTGVEELTRRARELADHGVRLKGHPLVWHTVKAPWVDRLPLDEAEQALRARVRREVTDFAGLIDIWDVVNEAVIMPRFENEPDGVRNAITRLCEKHGRVEFIRMAVDEARAANPDAVLVLNDFDLGPEYERLLGDVLDAGVRIDAIGLQSHMHQGFRGEDQLNEICDRFARFGVPLHWTETSLVSGDLMPAHIDDLNDHVVESWPSTPEGEQRQADEIVRHYRTLVEHPAVEAITYWGFDDATAWLGAPSGLVRPDGSLKPAYHALRELVRGEWWLAPTRMRTDAEGRMLLRGFAGSYEVSAAGSRGELTVTVGDSAARVALR